jgi:hypothetical protein
MAKTFGEAAHEALRNSKEAIGRVEEVEARLHLFPQLERTLNGESYKNFDAVVKSLKVHDQILAQYRQEIASLRAEVLGLKAEVRSLRIK